MQPPPDGQKRKRNQIANVADPALGGSCSLLSRRFVDYRSRVAARDSLGFGLSLYSRHSAHLCGAKPARN